MKTIQITHAILFLLLVTAIGCTSTITHFATVPEQQYDATRGKVVESKACGFQLFTFFPILINDRAERAYFELVAAAGGDYVTDIKVNEYWRYAVIGTVHCTEMEAMAYPRIASATQKTKKSSIDECIKACKENTKRTSEQCFDACNH